MVIGRDIFLTPGDIEQMRWVPELVFINCCHLGKPGPGTDRGALAANLGMQFIRMGVRAVVAAGWAVDDAAALAFADAFYRRMLDGETFGEAVRAAREEVWMRFPGVNTWGAYQCYGDPAYSLQRNGQQRQRERLSFHAPDELVVELDNLTEWLRVGAGSEGRDDATAARINGLLARIPETERTRWLAQNVAAALGFAWGEARFWEAAIDCLSTALSAAKGNCPLRALEQLANFRARHATELWQSRRARGVVETADETQARADLMDRAIADLTQLCERAPTAERLDLLGSAHKRRALAAESDPAARLAALDACADAYLKSFERGERKEAYPFTNWASAALLAWRLDAKRADDWRQGLETDIARLQAALQTRYDSEPDFWDGVALADLELVRLLERCINAPASGARARRTASLPRPCAEIAERILDGYRRVITRGASRARTRVGAREPRLPGHPARPGSAGAAQGTGGDSGRASTRTTAPRREVRARKAVSQRPEPRARQAESAARRSVRRCAVVEGARVNKAQRLRQAGPRPQHLHVRHRQHDVVARAGPARSLTVTMPSLGLGISVRMRPTPIGRLPAITPMSSAGSTSGIGRASHCGSTRPSQWRSTGTRRICCAELEPSTGEPSSTMRPIPCGQ